MSINGVRGIKEDGCGYDPKQGGGRGREVLF